MKGIILAGGSGSRLYPITKGVSKQLLPIYNKPMIYYPLSTLMLSGIKDILIISTPDDLPMFKRLLSDGSDIGINIEYKEQPSPNGLAEAFIIGEDFIGEDNCCLILGDNIFYGAGFTGMLTEAVSKLNNTGRASIFGYQVVDPERYGVAVFDTQGNIVAIEEKPQSPKSNYAVVGLYFYPNEVVKVAKTITPSCRGELEITDINCHFIKSGNIDIYKMPRGMTWLDTGTHESLYEASAFVETIEKRQGLQISSIEEISFRNGWITKDQLLFLAYPMRNNSYGKYLIKLANE